MLLKVLPLVILPALFLQSCNAQGQRREQEDSLRARICLNGRCKDKSGFGSGSGWSSERITDRSGFSSFGSNQRGSGLSSGIGARGEFGETSSSFGALSRRRGNSGEDMESDLFSQSFGKGSFSTSFGESFTGENGRRISGVSSQAGVSGAGSSRSHSRFSSNHFGSSNFGSRSGSNFNRGNENEYQSGGFSNYGSGRGNSGPSGSSFGSNFGGSSFGSRRSNFGGFDSNFGSGSGNNFRGSSSGASARFSRE